MPHIIKCDQVASLIDEWHCLHCQPIAEGSSSQNTTVDGYWAALLVTGIRAQKYPLLSALVRTLLFGPHGNADCERGFSENKRVVKNRAYLAIVTINGI